MWSVIKWSTMLFIFGAIGVGALLWLLVVALAHVGAVRFAEGCT